MATRGTHMNDQNGPSGIPAKRALALVLRGRRQVPVEQQQEEWQAVEDHFASVSAGDIEMALEEFRNSETREHREQAGKLLVAYFLWCWRTQREWVLRSECNRPGRGGSPTPKALASAVPTMPPDTEAASKETEVKGAGTSEPAPFGAGHPGVALETYVIAFAKTVCEGMASISADPDDAADEHKLPKWRRPDAAFGWVGMPGQPSFDPFWRARGIVACVELHVRKGFPWSKAISKAAYAFDVKTRTVQDALKSIGSKKNKPVFKGEPIEALEQLFERELSADKERHAHG
jgi:hypothetical protein